MALIRLNVTDPNASNDYLRTLTGKPVGTPPPLSDLGLLGQVAQGNFTYVSINVATELGFGFGSVGGSSERKIMTFDYAATANQDDPADNGIDSWTYGAGYRIGVLATDVEAKAQLGLAALAATATLKTSQIQIQVLRYGMPQGPSVPVPDFSNFDVTAYGLFTKWQQDVIRYISESRPQLAPVRIYASLSVDVDQYFTSSAPLRYALRRLQDKQTLRKALEDLRAKQIPHVVGHEPVVRATYARITGYAPYMNESGTDDGRSITDQDKRAAEEWLQQYDAL